jgi:hypothetical protein
MTETHEQTITTADLIQKLVDIREEKRRIKAREKELNEQWRSLELEALVRLDEQGMDKASSKTGTISIGENVLPQVVDWDQFGQHILDNEALYLLQRRPAAAAYRELLASGEEIPGVEPYTQRSINLRKK